MDLYILFFFIISFLWGLVVHKGSESFDYINKLDSWKASLASGALYLSVPLILVIIYITVIKKNKSTDGPDTTFKPDATIESILNKERNLCNALNGGGSNTYCINSITGDQINGGINSKVTLKFKVIRPNNQKYYQILNVDMNAYLAIGKDRHYLTEDAKDENTQLFIKLHYWHNEWISNRFGATIMSKKNKTYLYRSPNDKVSVISWKDAQKVDIKAYNWFY
jgi:hypothetical protein